MKDQYFGDVNDYRKYGLLRGLIASTGMELGVCWLRTPPDDRRDGEFRGYLRHPQRWRDFDPDLHDRLSRLLDPAIPRQVEWAEEWDLLPRARYHHSLLTDGEDARRGYFKAAEDHLKGCDLWFFDPDNGLEVNSVRYGKKRSSKYLYWREAAAAVGAGRSLVIYQHYPRQHRSTFVRGICGAVLAHTGAAAVIPVHTPHVLFLVVAQSHHEGGLRAGVAEITHRWKGQIDPSVDSSTVS